MASTHYCPTDRVHYTWDTGTEPLLTVADGDTVVFETRDVSDNQIVPGSDASVIAGLDWSRVYPLAGPVYVEGAAPGDTLAVEILDLHTKGWGWTAILPGLRTAGRRLHRAVPAHLRPHPRRRHAVPRGHRRPADAVHGHDGRLPGGRERAAGDAARHVRRQPRHAPARRRDDAVPAGPGRGRPLLDRRRPRLPGRRRDLRDRPRVADVRRHALQPDQGQLDPVAAVPHRARPADARRQLRRVLRHHRHRRRPLRRRPGRDARDDRPPHETYGLSPEDAYVLCSLVVDLKISEIVDAGDTSSPPSCRSRSSWCESAACRTRLAIGAAEAPPWPAFGSITATADARVGRGGERDEPGGRVRGVLGDVGGRDELGRAGLARDLHAWDRRGAAGAGV